MEERRAKTYERLELSDEKIKEADETAEKVYGEIRDSVIDCIKNRKPGTTYIPLDMHLINGSLAMMRDVEEKVEAWERSRRCSSKHKHQIRALIDLRTFNALHTCSECYMKHCILTTIKGFLDGMRKVEVSMLRDLEDDGIRKIILDMLSTYILAALRLLDAYQQALDTFPPEELQAAFEEAQEKVANHLAENLAKPKIDEEKEKELVMLYG